MIRGTVRMVVSVIQKPCQPSLIIEVEEHEKMGRRAIGSETTLVDRLSDRDNGCLCKRDCGCHKYEAYQYSKHCGLICHFLQNFHWV